MKKIQDYIYKLYQIIRTPNMAYLPGNIAFFFVLSLFPLLTLIGFIASRFSIDMNLIINLINNSLPVDVANVIKSYIEGKGFDTNIGIFMILGFYLSSNGANAIIQASNNLYGFPSSSYVRRKIKAMFLIILITLLFVFMLGFVGFGNHLLNILLSRVNDRVVVDIIYYLFMILKWPFTIFVVYFNVKLIYTIAPDWKIMSRHTTMGALFTTFGWIVVIKAYSYWVTNFTHYDLFYGSLSNIIILMLMVYFISYILVIGIAINVRTYEYKIED